MRISVLLGATGCLGLFAAFAPFASTSTAEQSADRASAGTTDRAPIATPTDSGNDGSIAGGLSQGADIILGDVQSINSYGPVGNIYAYVIGSHTCNIGDSSLAWINNGTPGLAMNAYRLHDGRLMQIGLSFVKHACCVINSNSPSVCGTSCSSSGFGLRPGCLDVYSAGFNAGQGRLGPRSAIDPYSGTFSPLPGGTGNSIFRRLQVHGDDLNPANYPGALYFVEGVYACTYTSQADNMLNNASYRRVNVNPTSFQMSLTDSINATVPAIFAWQDYGSGIGQPDESVEIVPVDVPDEGRFYVGWRVSENGDGTWRYDYAAYNLNSHLAGGSFSVPIPAGVNVTNAGFHAPFYHSGEQVENSPWTITVGDTEVQWSTAESFQENPNINALLWGTMYNFWFDADTPPTEATGTIGLFRPASPAAVSFGTVAPQPGETCEGDLNEDGLVDVFDLLQLLGDWGNCPGCAADLNGDGTVDVFDLLILLGNWGPC